MLLRFLTSLFLEINVGFNEGFGLSSVMFPHPVVYRSPTADCSIGQLMLASPWAVCVPMPAEPVGLGVLDRACTSCFSALLWRRNRARGTGCARQGGATPGTPHGCATGRGGFVAPATAALPTPKGTMGQGRLLSSRPQVCNGFPAQP